MTSPDYTFSIFIHTQVLSHFFQVFFPRGRIYMCKNSKMFLSNEEIIAKENALGRQYGHPSTMHRLEVEAQAT